MHTASQEISRHCHGRFISFIMFERSSTDHHGSIHSCPTSANLAAYPPPCRAFVIFNPLSNLPFSALYPNPCKCIDTKSRHIYRGVALVCIKKKRRVYAVSPPKPAALDHRNNARLKKEVFINDKTEFASGPDAVVVQWMGINHPSAGPAD